MKESAITLAVEILAQRVGCLPIPLDLKKN